MLADYDRALIGYELISIPPDADLEMARSVVEEALLPAGDDATEEELARLQQVTKDRKRSDDDLDLMLGAYIEECAAFPLDIVIAACRDLPKWHFWPSLAELFDRMQPLVESRRHLQHALDPASVEQAKARLNLKVRRECELLIAAAGRSEEILAYQEERQRRWDEADRVRAECATAGPAIPAKLTRDPVTAADISRSLKEAERGVAAFRMIAEDDPRIADICAKWRVEPTELKPAATEGTVKSRRTG